MAIIKGDKGCGKFKTKGKKYIMVGHCQVPKAYRLYDTDDHTVIELKTNSTMTKHMSLKIQRKTI